MSTSNQVWAMVDNSTNLVINTIVWDGDQDTWQPPSNVTMINVTGQTGVSIGCTYLAVNQSFDCPGQ
jgi:hypothetical protein